MMPSYTQLANYLASKRKKQKKQLEINEIRNADVNRSDCGSEESVIIPRDIQNIQSKSTGADSNDSNSVESYFAYCVGDHSEPSDCFEVL
jgi:hypothetical protein